MKKRAVPGVGGKVACCAKISSELSNFWLATVYLHCHSIQLTPPLLHTQQHLFWSFIIITSFVVCLLILSQVHVWNRGEQEIDPKSYHQKTYSVCFFQISLFMCFKKHLLFKFFHPSPIDFRMYRKILKMKGKLASWANHLLIEIFCSSNKNMRNNTVHELWTFWTQRGVHRGPGSVKPDPFQYNTGQPCCLCSRLLCSKKELPVAFNLSCMFITVSIYFSLADENKGTTIWSLVCNFSLLGKKREKVTKPQQNVMAMKSLN